jgi:hypothetical protein
MTTKLQLPAGKISSYTSKLIEDPKDTISGLSKINIFIGPNNSGKSRLMRAIASESKLTYALPSRYHETLKETKSILVKGIASILTGYITEINNFGKLIGELPDGDLITEDVDIIPTYSQLIKNLRSSNATNLSVTGRNAGYGIHDTQSLAVKLSQLGQAAYAGFKTIETFNTKKVYRKVYVPTIRAVRRIGEGNEDLISKRTRDDYFEGIKGTEIFSGQTLYDDIKELLLGDLQSRATIKRFQEFLSATFFYGKPVALIPRSGARVLYVKIGNEKEYPVHNLGDGIGMIIICSFPAFKYADQPLFLFLEEPELFLHPGMQRTLLGCYETFNQLQVFLTTHSNHLLEVALDSQSTSIFSFHKKISDEDKGEELAANFEFERVISPDSSILDDLGVRNTSVLLANCTIWVEGVTDRRYIRHFISIYKDYLKADENAKFRDVREDINYGFVEYSGSNISHWSFLDDTGDSINAEKICGRLILICDKDEAQWKKERQDTLRKVLKDRLIVPDCREIENILPVEAILAVLAKYGEHTPTLRVFQWEDYRNKPLGLFLEDLTRGQRKRVASYQTESGTVSAKTDFCAHALTALNNFTQLTPEAQKMTQSIYDFIVKSNGL